MFVFDHANAYGICEKDFKRLERLGFATQPFLVEHPGTQFCRFIGFQGAYLEFIEVKEQAAFLSVLSNSSRAYETGFSLRYEGCLKAYFEEKKSAFRQFGVEYYHKNYEWKKNSVDNLPGWNFVNFQGALIPGINIWVTEYEEPRKRSIVQKGHPNSVNKVLGAYWNVSNQNDPKDFLNFIEKPLVDGEVRLSSKTGHFSIWMENEGKDSMVENLSLEKKGHPFKAMVLECESQVVFEKHSSLRPTFKFKDKDAYQISMHEAAWDIWVVV